MKALLIEGIRAINVLYKTEVPIYINPFLDYIDENCALFGISKSDFSNINNSEEIYDKLSRIELEIVDYGIIKGAKKIKIIVPK
ncbi:MAG TPA: hypothetical protein PKY25_00470 [Bacilli bacterium]|nr:hypothetical protein [Bacilli bacterium]